MKTVNVHEAKTHLSRLIAQAVAGEPFVIARAGKPMVKVEAIASLEAKPKRRLGGMGACLTWMRSRRRSPRPNSTRS